MAKPHVHIKGHGEIRAEALLLGLALAGAAVFLYTLGKESAR